MQEDRPPEGYNVDFLRDVDSLFDLVAFAKSHPLAVGAGVIVILALFVFTVERGRRRRAKRRRDIAR